MARIDRSDFIRQNARYRRLGCHETNIPCAATAVRSRCNVRKSDNYGPLLFGFADRPAGFCVLRPGGEPGGGRSPATDRDPAFLRPSDRCERGAVRAGGGPWFV